jgi:DNA-binding Lrp family transcriptional regulator
VRCIIIVWTDGFTVSQESHELKQRFNYKQDRITKELKVKPLPRQQDRINRLTWGDTPLAYDRPRFGALETQLSDRPRGGWQVTLARSLQDAESHFLDWVLWREALLSLLLPHLRHIPETADLGLYAGLRYGDYTETERMALITFWKQVSPAQHYQHYIYDAPFGFPLFEQVVNGTFLHRAIHWLNTLRPTSTGAPIATPTYTATLERWMLETHTPLTKTELDILTALNQITTLHQSQLAEQLEMTPSALSQNLNKLAQKHLLRLYSFINFPLIGLVPLDVIFNIPKRRTLAKLHSLFEKMRYIYSIHTIQQKILLARFLIPHDRIDEFKKWVNEIQTHEQLVPLSIVRDSKVLINWNFSYYLPENGWPTDFSFIQHQVKSSIHEFTNDKLPTIRFSQYIYEPLCTKTFPIKLRIEDFTYFKRFLDIIQLTDRVSAQPSREAREAGLTETEHMRYRRRVQKLEKLNISSSRGYWLHHIGLNTTIHILIRDLSEITAPIISSLQYFPCINGVVFENETASIFLYVPNHITVDTLSTLRKIFARNDLNAVIDAKPAWQSLTGFRSPMTSMNYDFQKGKWKWDNNALPKI